jgi:hypothetical protein
VARSVNLGRTNSLEGRPVAGRLGREHLIWARKMHAHPSDPVKGGCGGSHAQRQVLRADRNLVISTADNLRRGRWPSAGSLECRLIRPRSRLRSLCGTGVLSFCAGVLLRTTRRVRRTDRRCRSGADRVGPRIQIHGHSGYYNGHLRYRR